ncbi:MAG TPA: non-ribosomal peptide synthetase [Steroidobacteraceae bacterium]|nr:non-ribosomal peptide synthetase [Steroidobacteraceae bacterium]
MDREGRPEWEYDEFPRSALDASIWHRYEAVAGRYPDRPAVRDSTHSYTYAALAAEARHIGAKIAAAHAEAGPVAIFDSNEARYAVLLLSVLRAGRIALLLDANHPLERNRKIMAHAQATLVVTTGAHCAQAHRLASASSILNVDEQRGASEDTHQPTTTLPDAPACIVYTSGSTGVPKGVVQSHRGVLHDVMQSVNTSHMGVTDTIAVFYSPAVIAGFRTLLSGLLSGAAMEVLPPLAYGPEKLAQQIDALAVTVLRLSPSLFRHLAAARTGGFFRHVRLVSLGGDRVDWSDFDLFKAVCPRDAKFYVHLGATECWTVYSQWCVDASVRDTTSALPVGYSMPERPVDVLDADGHETPIGETGEIVVSSRYVALGYWNEPELTRSAFRSDANDPSFRIYKTGDLGRRRADGLLEYVGRKDQQVKLHGYRVEPNEVEAALKACTGLRDAAIVVRRNAEGLPMALIGYVTREVSQTHLLPRHLLAMLSGRLPPHMMPAQIVLLEEFPWLPNFKIDRQRLAAMDAAMVLDASKRQNPLLIERLIDLFQEITKTSSATPEDSMLSLGGDSLQFMEAVLQIGAQFDVVIEPDGYQSARSIADLAREIADKQRAKSLAPAT